MISKIVTRIVACLPLILLGPMPALGQNYAAEADQSDWVVESTALYCGLSHEIPGYGRAIFSQPSGKNPEFKLITNLLPLQRGKVNLYVGAEKWSNEGESKLIATVDFEKNVEAIQLPKNQTTMTVQQLQTALASGKSIYFNTPDKVDTVVISHINFLSAYEGYQQCMAQMLPVDFATLKLTRLYFDSGSAALSRETILWLDRIITQLRNDPAIMSIEIGGHSDRVGGYTDNRLLANRRMWAVKDYLVFRGVNQDLITLRSYSDSKPIASNGTATGRAKNRRVEVKLFH